MYLERITSPEDIKSYTPAERSALAEEMRAALIRRTSSCGGHIAPNLGIIEATIALHTVFDSPRQNHLRCVASVLPAQDADGARRRICQ